MNHTLISYCCCYYTATITTSTYILVLLASPFHFVLSQPGL